MKSFCIFLCTVTLILCFSCTNKKTEISYDDNGLPIITNQFKLEFLNKALKDTSTYNLLHYKEPFIHQQYFNNNDTRHSVKNGHLENVTLTKFISNNLNAKDTSFISKQLDSLDVMDMSKLKDYGFNFINWNKLKKYEFTSDSLVVVNLVTQDSIETLEKAIELNKLIWLTKPIFNKELNKAYIEVGNFIYWSNALLYEKKGDKWMYSRTILSRQM